MITSKPSLVFSVWRWHVPEHTNRQSVTYAKRSLDGHGITYTVAQGCYKGTKEPALVVADTKRARVIVQGIAHLFEQETILAIDKRGNARLEDCDGHTVETLGKMRAVPELAARKCSAWTRIGTQFYTTELFGSNKP